jgi:anti-sigma regulatory factor (Ser/Thr protein kinase)
LALSDPAATGGVRHTAWFYRTDSEYFAALDEFVRAGQARGEPVLVAIPKARLPSGWMPPGGRQASFADMQEMGGNPARIISALRAFADSRPGQRIRYVGEAAWPTRSAAELQEAARYEALINLAFADAKINILCPYNAVQLSPAVLADACSTHPTLFSHGMVRVNHVYLGPGAFPACLEKPLVAPASARALCYEQDLRPVRALVADAGRRAGLSRARCTDLMIAASEVAANTLRHTSGGGVVRLWITDDEVICQLEDAGFIADPLAGHWRPAGDPPGGQGLWLVNQVCDLAEIRTSNLGTTVRLHMYRRPDQPGQALGGQ